ILEANARYCELVGYSEDELRGQTYELLKSGRHTREFMDSMWAAASAGKTWRGEFCDRAKGGAHIWLNSIVVPPLGPQGAVCYFITISTDVRAARRQFLALQAMIDNFPGGIALIDPELRLAASNDLYRALLELPAELFTGGVVPMESILRAQAERGDF